MIVASAIIKGDIIYVGKRHHNIIHDNPYVLKNCVQGFIDEKGEFMNRETAAAYAYAVGQIKEPSRYLFSEDLW